MAHTDKTRPEWVQLMDPTNRGWLKEYHHHEKGVCDIEDFDPRQHWRWSSNCHIWPSRAAVKAGVYGRRSRAVKYYTHEYTRGERVAWREIRDRVIKGDLDAADEYPRWYNHRHRALWDAF